MGKLLKKFEERRKYHREHPIESGNFIGELFIVIILSMALCLVINTLLFHKFDLVGVGLAIALFFLILGSIYIDLYKPVKLLERQLYDKKAQSTNDEKVV